MPECMKTEKVKPYYIMLKKKQKSLRMKRMVDLVCSFVLLVPLSPVMLTLGIWIKLDSKGPVFYRQERITRYGQPYRIFKFRTMIVNAETKGPSITKADDGRITNAGRKIRKLRLDELPQLFNVLSGDMSFVGTRPEVKKYVEEYTDEMMATLLMPAGITSTASIEFKNEDEIIKYHQEKEDRSTDDIYIKSVLPVKMRYNLQDINNFSIWRDFRIMLRTVLAVLK